MVEILTLHATCSPEIKPGGPVDGDREWIYKVPLSDGRTLELHMGQTGHDALRAMALHEELDDAADAAMAALDSV